MASGRLVVPSVVAGLLLALGAIANGLSSKQGDPRPQPAIAAIVDAFDKHPLVGLGESHRNQQVHDFIVSLVRDPRFLQKVDDIVVEFGSARYQDPMDRYVAGEPLSPEDLRRVWRDTVNILVWDAPVYQRFFETVRTVNRTRPPGSRLRVLLADPPLDWTAIQRREEWERVAATRDQHAAEIVEREVLGKKHRALLIFGSDHLTRDSAFFTSPDRQRTYNLAEILAERHPGAILLIWSHTPGWMTSQLDSRLASWPKPAFALLNGTWLGASSVGPRGQSPTLEQLADAFLYLGPIKRQTDSEPSPTIYRDSEYMRELLRRDAIQGGFNTSELERLGKSK